MDTSLTKKDIGKVVNYIQPDILMGGREQKVYQGIFMGFDKEYKLCMIKCKNGRIITKNELQVWLDILL